MKIFNITVKAVGYETVVYEVTARTLDEARKREYSAVTMWMKHNNATDIRGFASVSTAPLHKRTATI